MTKLQGLSPDKFFSFFEQISEIPRGSGNTKEISEYIIKFAKDRELEYVADEVGNVVIYKEKSRDAKSNNTIILQGHLDMVAVKEDDIHKDMETEGLDLCVEGDFLKAKGTSLGADDGVAVCFMLSILDSKTLTHPPIEAVFTVDEETGMLGADALDTSVLKGKMMLNIDTEEEGEFCAGCAGGARNKLVFKNDRDPVDGHELTVEVTGLTGGHSGMEIYKNGGNAACIINEILAVLTDDGVKPCIIEFNAGSADNVIPVSGKAEVILPSKEFSKYGGEEAVREKLDSLIDTIEGKYAETDPDLSITYNLSSVERKAVKAMTSKHSRFVVTALSNIPNGVIKYNELIPDMVETSLNLGTVEINHSVCVVQYLVRSNVEGAKRELIDNIKHIAKKNDAKDYVSGNYPAWEFSPNSRVRDVVMSAYQNVTGEEGKISVVHAGLECGIFTKKIRGLDCVSFGPRIDDIHTTKEKVSISSVQKYDKMLKIALEELALL